MEENLLEKLRSISKKHMEDDKFYHDYVHVLGVYSNVEKLLEHEKGDRLVLLTAALFHDICRDMDDHDEEGAKLTEDILNNVEDYPKDKISAVTNIIRKHEEGQLTHDEKLFSDADKMEAFNLLGFSRGLMMFAARDYSLKDAVYKYRDLLNEWYDNFYFDITKQLIEEDRNILVDTIENLIEKYDKLD